MTDDKKRAGNKVVDGSGALPDKQLTRLPDVSIPKQLRQPRVASDELIHRSMMRGGGEPFGAPFELGLSSLTARLVKLLNQTGFFKFETLERLQRRNQRNKFTRHGAAPFVGEHRPPRRGNT